LNLNFKFSLFSIRYSGVRVGVVVSVTLIIVLVSKIGIWYLIPDEVSVSGIALEINCINPLLQKAIYTKPLLARRESYEKRPARIKVPRSCINVIPS
jgi:hypothetical protein